MIEKIYFDMDGVLADFDRGIRELCGLTPRSQELVDEQRDNEMWAAVRRVGHFYDKLEPLPGAVALFRAVWDRWGDRCEILTGIPKPKRGILTAGDDKRSWASRLLSPELRVNVVFKEEKKNYCTGPGCVLIDDYSANVAAWRRAGGTAILHEDAAGTLQQLQQLGALPEGGQEEAGEVE